MYTPNNIYSGWENDIVSSALDVRIIYRGADGSSSAETVVPESKIQENSVTVKENICLGKFHVGGAISRQLNIQLIDNTYDLTYCDIVLAQKYTLQNNTVITFPMGTYIVDAESVRKDQMFTELTAYDYFIKADSIVSQQEADAFTGTNLWDVFSYAAAESGLTLGFVRSDISDYSNFSIKPNFKAGQSLPLDLQKASEMGATYRDVMSSAAALIGCALKIDRVTNRVMLVKFTTPRTSVYTLNATNSIKRQINDKYSLIRYVSYGINKGMQINYVGDGYYAADLSLGTNVILPDESYSMTAMQIQAAVESRTGLQSVELRDVDVKWFGYPGLEAGDYITSQQTWLDSQEVSFYVMENVWKPHQPCTIRSFGAVSSNVYATGSATSYGESRRASRANVTTSQEAQNIQNQIDTSSSYSTAEHTVGRWLDNNWLYEKTYVFNALGTDQTRIVSQALDISRLREIVESRGQLLSSGYSMPIPTMPLTAAGTVDEDNAVYFVADTANDLLKVHNGAVDRSGEKAYITLRYTADRYIIYGYALTQSAYDLLTPESDKYYAISNTASGEITDVLRLTQSQYDDMSTHSSDTLYIITADGTTISYAYMGDTGLIKLYLGSNVIWTPPARLGYDEATFLDITGAGAYPKTLINTAQSWYVSGYGVPRDLNSGNYVILVHVQPENNNTCNLKILFFPISMTDITVTKMDNQYVNYWKFPGGGYVQWFLSRDKTFPASVFASGSQTYEECVIQRSLIDNEYKNVFSNFATLHFGTDIVPPYTAYNPI